MAQNFQKCRAPGAGIDFTLDQKSSVHASTSSFADEQVEECWVTVGGAWPVSR